MRQRTNQPRRLMGLDHDLLVATMFLTRLPIRLTTPWKDDDLASSVIMFPVVGALLGLVGGLIYAGLSALHLPSFLAATAATAFLVAVTGALHEDGLADVADGLGGGQTKDDKLRIMRDSRLGSYGTLALIFALLLRIGALSALAAPLAVACAMTVTAALSRAAMPVAMVIMRQAREDGVAARAGKPHPRRVEVTAIIAIVIACLCQPWRQAIVVTFLAALSAILFLVLVQRHIGGVTGDVLGALQQVVEIVSLLTIVSLTSAS